MSKNHVKSWQRTLKDVGFYSGYIDGLFGSGTLFASREAVGNEPASDLPSGPAILAMVNQNSTRNKPITTNLHDKLLKAAFDVYGPGCKIMVYSGGQDRKGHGNRRRGTVRHDDYGDGGRAADCYIYLYDRKLFGLELAKLGQHWLANGYGGCGLEMATGGIHLDEWTTPPKGGGMFWTYKYSDGKTWGAKARNMLIRGARGEMP